MVFLEKSESHGMVKNGKDASIPSPARAHKIRRRLYVGSKARSSPCPREFREGYWRGVKQLPASMVPAPGSAEDCRHPRPRTSSGPNTPWLDLYNAGIRPIPIGHLRTSPCSPLIPSARFAVDPVAFIKKRLLERCLPNSGGILAQDTEIRRKLFIVSRDTRKWTTEE